MNARYDGFSESALFLSQDKLAWVSHLYNGVEKSFDTGAMASINYKVHSKLGKGSAKNILKFSNWGPPYYKIKKTVESVGNNIAANTVTKST